MNRHRLLVWLFAGLMALLGGCAAIRERVGGRGQREPVIPESRNARRELPEETPERTERTPSGRPPAIAKSKTEPLPDIDPATRMLIDTDLKDLPFEERRAWRVYLASVEPKQIPAILQARHTHPTLQPGDPLPQPGTGPSQIAEASREKRAGESRSDELFQTAEAPHESGVEWAKATDEGVATTQETIQPALSLSLADEAHAGRSSTVKQPAAAAANPSAEVPAASGKSALDSIKIWPRSDRSFADRFAGAKLPLPAPWQRHESSEKPTNIPPTPPPAIQEPVVELPRANPKAAYWEDELQKLISVMEAEVARTANDTLADREAYIQRQVYLRMLYLMAAEPEKAQFPITGAEPAHQEFWTSVFWGMSNYFDESPLIDPAARATQTVSQFHSASRHLQQFAELELHSVTFCQAIDGWGQYQRFERDEFEPGQIVLVYAEIKNFQSELTPEGQFRTRIAWQFEIVRLGGEDQLIHREDLGETEDLCRSLRTDYYGNYRIKLPSHLTPGDYELRLTVEDKLNQRFANQKVGFRVR